MSAVFTFCGIPIPRDVWLRARRLNRKYPGNYDGGYLEAWCEWQWRKEPTK